LRERGPHAGRLAHAARYFLLRWLPPCNRIAALLSESLERRLTPSERCVVRLHRIACVWCEWYLRQIGQIRSASREIGQSGDASALTDGAGMPKDVRDRIRRRLAERN
jgi:hypothetical protein